MPPKLSKPVQYQNWIKELPDEEKKNFKIESNNVFCNVCSRLYNFTKKSQLTQHIETDLHRNSVNIASGTGHRQSLFSVESPANQFNHDLCQAMIAANLPWNKLENPHFKGFLEKYCKRTIPSQSTIRKNCLKPVYIETINSIRNEIGDQHIWMGVDETTDKCGRFVVNIMIGSLNGNPSNPHLLMCREVERANNTTISQLVVDALHFLWPQKRTEEIAKLFLVFLSDAAPYMVKAVKNLKVTYNQLLHVTCLAHGLNRVAEVVRHHFDAVNSMLASVKAVFKKAPSRIRKYHDLFPNMPLPPEPVLTRWGTWLKAADFYAKNLESIKAVVNSLDSDEALCIEKAQKIFERPDVGLQLADLTANFTFIADSITELETRNLPLSQSLAIIVKVRSKLQENSSSLGKKVLTKLEEVLKKNPDFHTMEKVSNVLQGNCDVAINLEPSVIANLKYCPVTSVEVERGFSMEKALLSDRNRRLTMENLEMKLVTQYELGFASKSTEK